MSDPCAWFIPLSSATEPAGGWDWLAAEGEILGCHVFPLHVRCPAATRRSRWSKAQVACPACVCFAARKAGCDACASPGRV